MFLNGAPNARRYGNVSDMWLHRRLRDTSGFPQPVVICGRRFWRLNDLRAWERNLAEQRSKRPSPRRRGGQMVDQLDAAQ